MKYLKSRNRTAVRCTVYNTATSYKFRNGKVPIYPIQFIVLRHEMCHVTKCAMSRKGASVHYVYIFYGVSPQNKVRTDTVPVCSVLQSNRILQTVLIYPMQFTVWYREVSCVTKV